jgi:hypothetical protein
LRHGRLCELVYQLLARISAGAHAVGADQFVYFDAANPKRCLAPDAFFKRGVPPTMFPSWKTWEHGAPELCVEVLSPSDTEEVLTLETKMERYRSLGVEELVLFDTDAPIGKRLRVFDRIEGDLVERLVEGETTPSVVLSVLGTPVSFVVAPAPVVGDALRLQRHGELVLVDAEERDVATKQRDVANEERDSALRRVAELEREIARLKGA